MNKKALFSKYSMRSLVLTALTLTGATVCLGAAAQQRIGGRIANKESHLPVAAASVVLSSNNPAQQFISTSGANGEFAFAHLEPGSYTIEVSASGFYPAHQQLVLSPRATPVLDIELIPKAPIEAEVTVRASTQLTDSTQSATVTMLTGDQIRAIASARRAQLTDLITPFISSAVGGHDNLVHLRGNELSLNTFINGVSFFDNPHQLFTPGISPDIIQSVSVITGGFPAEFGNRFGGILDIVTRNGFDAGNHGSVTIGAGSHLRHNVSADYGGHTKRFGYFGYLQGFESQRYLNTPERKTFHDFGKGARGFVQLDYRPSAKDMFKLVMTGDGSNFELPNTLEDEQRGRDFFQRNREQTAIFSWDHLFSQSSALSTSVYERFAQSSLLPTNDPVSIQADSRRHDVTAGVKSDYSLYWGSRHVFKAGIDLMLLRLREDVSFNPRRQAIDIEPFAFRGRKTGGEASVYVQDQIRLSRNLTASAGIRYDQYSLVTSGHTLSPRINLAYALQQGRTVLHFSYNRFFSPPPIENLLLSSRLGFAGHPPQISRSHHFEAGVSHSIHDRLLIKATGYWRSDRNSFETTEIANVRLFVPTTFARGKAYGIELSGRLEEIRKIGISGYFGYTAQRAFQTGPITGGFTVEQTEGGTSAPAAFDQIHTAVGGVHWQHHRSGIWTDASFEYGSGTPASFPGPGGGEQRVRLPQHLIFNFSSGIDLFRKDRTTVTLQFNLENATDRVYAIAKESELTPLQFSPPRFFSGSLKVRF